MPRWLVPGFILLVLISLIPATMIHRARNSLNRNPRINLIPDMDYQPKYLPQTANPMFADGRAMRPHVPGTVARGELIEDERFDQGRAGDAWITTIPREAAADAGTWSDLVARGQDRFNIYCAPCHGASGNGEGMVALRALALQEQGLANWTPPASLHGDLVRSRPAGHLFNTITNGIRNMPAYGPQIPPADRWAIVSYIRALQRSQRARIEDVPEDVRATLQ